MSSSTLTLTILTIIFSAFITSSIGEGDGVTADVIQAPQSPIPETPLPPLPDTPLPPIEPGAPANPVVDATQTEGATEPVVGTQNIYAPSPEAEIRLNIRAEVLEDERRLFSRLLGDTQNLKIEILASFESWTESPQYVDSLDSILFSSPSDRNLYRYNLETKTTSLFIQNAGEFGGAYSGEIPLEELLEAGPNGMITGLDGFEDYVILCQLALRRVIAFDPTNLDEDRVIIIADKIFNEPLNSPNDITISPDKQSIYFTDPPFGLQREGDRGFLDSFSRSELGFGGVYRIDAHDIRQGITEPKLVADMYAPNGIAITNDNQFMIVTNTGTTLGWSPYWNVFRITSRGYTLHTTIDFNLGEFPVNTFALGGAMLADGLEIFDDDILLAVGPNGVYVIDLRNFKIVGRIAIDVLISNIHVHDGWLYVTGLNNLFRIKLQDGPGGEFRAPIQPNTPNTPNRPLDGEPNDLLITDPADIPQTRPNEPNEPNTPITAEQPTEPNPPNEPNPQNPANEESTESESESESREER
eukprot:90905_1